MAAFAIAFTATAAAFLARATPGDPASAEPSTFSGSLELARQSYAQRRCPEALKILDSLIRQPDFALRAGATAADALRMKSQCLAVVGDHANAFVAIREATRAEGASYLDWRWRTYEAFKTNDLADAVGSLEELTDHWPDKTFFTSDTTLGLLDKISDSNDERLLTRYLAALDKANYAPSDPFDTADRLWRDYALILVAQRDDRDAARVARTIVSPDFLLEFTLDNRLRRIAESDPQWFDPVASAQRKLDWDRRLSERLPESLAGVAAVSEDYRRLGRGTEAMAVLDEAKAGVEQGGRFKDTKDFWDVYWTERAMVLRDLGKPQDAAKAFVIAITRPDSSTSLSASLSYSEFQLERHQPADAIHQLENIETHTKPTDHGRARLWGDRACALEELGLTAQAADAVAKVRSYAGQNRSALSTALMCTKNLDAAAKWYAERLQNPRTRAEALLALCTFQYAPGRFSAEDVAVRRRFLDRADVKAAIAAVGRVRDVPLYE